MPPNGGQPCARPSPLAPPPHSRLCEGVSENSNIFAFLVVGLTAGCPPSVLVLPEPAGAIPPRPPRPCDTVSENSHLLVIGLPAGCLSSGPVLPEPTGAVPPRPSRACDRVSENSNIFAFFSSQTPNRMPPIWAHASRARRRRPAPPAAPLRWGVQKFEYIRIFLTVGVPAGCLPSGPVLPEPAGAVPPCPPHLCDTVSENSHLLVIGLPAGCLPSGPVLPEPAGAVPPCPPHVCDEVSENSNIFEFL
ncbi:hypothetical protein DFH07DRAFT_947911 [Mycena maculata]|uniref:Uncharacterized protein n=1 Tax=Mycena maculata TaxID=230809 RepID=A0AAD7P2H6_9AGAR|nr:hypothetical protein DFH07DRAFT_947911 [Mycena maculata]